jgi:hypothetical protein
MLYRVRKQLVEEGLEAVLSRKQRATPAAPKIFDGVKEAKLIALACSEPPKGRVRWTLRLLEEKVVELKIVDTSLALVWIPHTATDREHARPYQWHGSGRLRTTERTG